MIFTKQFNLFKNEIKFNLNLYYFRLFDPYKINHYNLINKLNKYKSISENYYNKYPGTVEWINLNEEIFKQIPEAKNEYLLCSEDQKLIKKQLITDIKLLCVKNKNCTICSDFFQSFYIEYDYHIEQNIDNMIHYIKKDIIFE